MEASPMVMMHVAPKSRMPTCKTQTTYVMCLITSSSGLGPCPLAKQTLVTLYDMIHKHCLDHALLQSITLCCLPGIRYLKAHAWEHAKQACILSQGMVECMSQHVVMW